MENFNWKRNRLKDKSIFLQARGGSKNQTTKKENRGCEMEFGSARSNNAKSKRHSKLRRLWEKYLSAKGESPSLS